MSTPSLLLAITNVGRIQGGWPYVWASYGLAWATFFTYSVSLWIRRPKG